MAFLHSACPTQKGSATSQLLGLPRAWESSGIPRWTKTCHKDWPPHCVQVCVCARVHECAHKCECMRAALHPSTWPFYTTI